MNKVILIGRLVSDPEIRTTDKGSKVGRFRLAINNGKDNPTTFVNVVCFNILAEQCATYLQKSSKILIEGRLDYKQDENKKDHYSVVAQNVQFLKNIKEVKAEPQAVVEPIQEIV